jgi:hypothetical protein
MSQLPHHFIKVVNLFGSELGLYKKFLIVILEMLDILVVATLNANVATNSYSYFHFKCPSPHLSATGFSLPSIKSDR